MEREEQLQPATRKMRIPVPEIDEDSVEFFPIVRLGHFEPFGYRKDPDDPLMLLPIPHELLLLEQAKKHLKRFSLRDVAAWLSSESGRKISHQGLKDRVKADIKKDRESTNSRHLARQLAFAYTKARRLEASRFGKKAPSEEDIKAEILKIVGEACQDWYW